MDMATEALARPGPGPTCLGVQALRLLPGWAGVGPLRVSHVVVAEAAEASEGHGVAGVGAQTYGVAPGDGRGPVLVKVGAA